MKPQRIVVWSSASSEFRPRLPPLPTTNCKRRCHMKTILALVLAALIIPSLAFAEEVTHDNLVIVFDGSGSMKESISDGSNDSKITVAKTALKKVIDQIPQSTHVGILLFVSDNWGKMTIDWLTPIGPMNKDSIKASIDAIQPNGGTPLGTSIKMAADALLEVRKRQFNRGNYKLLVVTDGEATPDDEKAKMQTYAQEVVSPNRRIELNVIGIGMPGKHMLSQTAQKYWGANDEIALNKALATAVQVETTNADAAQADYDLLKGVPDDVAKAWLGEVTNMDLANWPIGEQKPEPPPPATVQNADPNAKSNQPPDQQPAPEANQGRQKGCSASETGVNPVPTSLLTLCLIALLITRRSSQRVRVRT